MPCSRTHKAVVRPGRENYHLANFVNIKQQLTKTVNNDTNNGSRSDDEKNHHDDYDDDDNDGDSKVCKNVYKSKCTS